jgi:hypothetical protein
MKTFALVGFITSVFPDPRLGVGQSKKLLPLLHWGGGGQKKSKRMRKGIRYFREMAYS